MLHSAILCGLAHSYDHRGLVSLQAETANVLWSFSTSEDPSSEELSFANIHTYKGAVSLNLLGGLPSAAPDPADLQYFDVTVDNVS